MRPSRLIQRLAWGKTVGLGAQHVVAMFGATFVFPLVMGLDPNLAIMFSGHLHDPVPADLPEQGAELPRHERLVRRQRRGDPRTRQGGDSSDVTGAILVGGLVLAAVGAAGPLRRRRADPRILPPAVTGAVVMLIGFNLAPVVAGIYWPAGPVGRAPDRHVHGLAAVLLPGFWSRIAVFLALIFGYLLSWLFDAIFGPITSVLGGATRGRPSTTGSELGRRRGRRLDRLAQRHAAPTASSVVHGPSFSLTRSCWCCPA